MILLIDCDSLVFASCLVSKKENREEKHYTDIEDSIAKFEEQYFKIVNDLEEDYEIDKIYNFNKVISENLLQKSIKPIETLNSLLYLMICITL